MTEVLGTSPERPIIWSPGRSATGSRRRPEDVPIQNFCIFVFPVKNSNRCVKQELLHLKNTFFIKIDDLIKNLFFRCNSPCFTHLFLLFTEKTNIQKFQMGTFTGCLRDLIAGVPGEQMMGRSGDVGGTSVIHVF